jgi:hypothetical protein
VLFGIACLPQVCTTRTLPGPGPDITAEQVLERWTNAVGGIENVKRIESVYIKNFHEGTGGSGDVEEWTTRAGQRRQWSQLEFEPVLVVFDGKSGWQRHDGRARKLDSDETAGQRSAALVTTLAHLLPGHPGMRVELAKDDESGSCFGLSVQVEGARPSLFYIDKSTGLPRWNVQRFPTTVVTFEFLEWKDVAGVKLPAKWHIRSEGGYEAVETLKDARINPPLDPTLFSRPLDAPKNFRFLADGKAPDIPFETDGGHIFVRGRVQGSEPVWLTIDTGASGCLFDAEFATSVGLEARGQATATGPAGAMQGAFVRGASVTLPGVELTIVTAQTLPLEFLSRGVGRRIVAILGYEFFDRFVVELDYAARVMRLRDPDGFEYTGPGESIPITLRSMQPYVRARLDAGKDKSSSGEFVVDLGSSATLALSHDFDAEHGILAASTHPLHDSAGGVGGRFDMEVARIDALHLGSFTISKPVTLFPHGRMTEEGSAGNIGAGALKRFRVIVDYANERMILEPTARLSEPDEYDMSGLSIVGVGAEYDTIRVRQVSDDSPASRAGIRRDDILEAVDGRPIAELGFSGLRDLFRHDGTELVLDVRTGDSVRKVRLKLSRRI